MLYHYFFVTTITGNGSLIAHLIAPLRIGWSGVDLFFVLSGFLIGGILIDARESENYLRVFYARRFFRIVPLYLVFLSFSFAIILIAQHGYLQSVFCHDLLPRWSYLSFIQNLFMAKGRTFGSVGLSVTWSLAVEEQFYLTLPLMILLCNPRRLKLAVIAVVSFVIVARLAACFLFPLQTTSRYVLMPFRADALLLGTLIAAAMRSHDTVSWLERHGRQIAGVLVILLLGTLWLIHFAPDPSTLPMQTFGYTWLACLYGTFLIYGITQKSSWIATSLRLKPLRALGGIAYGVYLLHAHTLILLSGLLFPKHASLYDWPVLDSWTQFALRALAFAMTIFICKASWRLFEKPLIQIGHRWRYCMQHSIEVENTSLRN